MASKLGVDKLVFFLPATPLSQCNHNVEQKVDGLQHNDDQEKTTPEEYVEDKV